MMLCGRGKGSPNVSRELKESLRNDDSNGRDIITDKEHDWLLTVRHAFWCNFLM